MRRYPASEMEGIRPYEDATTVRSTNPMGGWNDVATRIAKVLGSIPSGTHLRVSVRPDTASIPDLDANGNVIPRADRVDVFPRQGLPILEMADRALSDSGLDEAELVEVIDGIDMRSEHARLGAFLVSLISALRFLPNEPAWHMRRRGGNRSLGDKEWSWLRRVYTDGHDPVDGEPFYVRDACAEQTGYRACLRSAERQMRGAGKGTVPLYDPMGNEIGEYVHRGGKAATHRRRRLDADVSCDGTYLGNAFRGDSAYDESERMRERLKRRSIR